jgi:hypothetical protein
MFALLNLTLFLLLYAYLPCVCVTDLELLEGLDSSKHGERAMSVVALVKELDASVQGGMRAKDGADGTV